MLSDFLLSLVDNPKELVRLRMNPNQFLETAGLSGDALETIKNGDIHALRGLLYREAAQANQGDSSRRPYLASDYTVSTSGDTPHCPITSNWPSTVSGAIDRSFWETMDPANLWESGGLTIVGTGIRAGLQTTPETLIFIQTATKVLYLVADLISQLWIQKLNATAESMQALYKKGAYRLDIYNDIVKRILSEVRDKSDVCVVFYGHPGSFVYPAHEAIRIARLEGFKARMLPGISAEANLLGDLGVDPGVAGAQSYEATNFLLNKYRFDTSAGLILWQIGLCGYAYWDGEYKANRKGLEVLVDYLKDFYGESHEVFLYEASELPLGNAKAQRLSLSTLPDAKISGVATLYIPPKAPPSPNLEMARRLGISPPDKRRDFRLGKSEENSPKVARSSTDRRHAMPTKKSIKSEPEPLPPERKPMPPKPQLPEPKPRPEPKPQPAPHRKKTK